MILQIYSTYTYTSICETSQTVELPELPISCYLYFVCLLVAQPVLHSFLLQVFVKIFCTNCFVFRLLNIYFPGVLVT